MSRAPRQSTSRARVPGAALALLVAVGCKSEPVALYKPGLDRERVTRVNLRPDGNVLYSANFLSVRSLIAAGSRARVTFYSPSEIRMLLNGVQFVMYPLPFSPPVEFPTDDAGVDAFLDKLFADRKEDVRLRPRSDREILKAVSKGEWLWGMTKEEVFMSLGPPMLIDGKPSLALPHQAVMASDVWTYPQQMVFFDTTHTTLHFGGGKLVKR
jgi:hypothetical protein